MLIKMPLAVLVSVLLTIPAKAEFIVDTGQPGWTGESTLLAVGEGRAGRFTTTSHWTISSIETFIWNAAIGATATVAIYTDGGVAPDTEIFSAEFHSSNDIISAPEGAWEGVSGLGWTLTPATYWVSFEGRAGQTMSAGLVNYPVPHPLDAYAWYEYGTLDWHVGTVPWDIFAVRIEASPIPLPASSFLLTSGLAGLFFRRRRLGDAPSNSSG